MPESLEQPKGGRTTADVIRRSLRRLAIATALLYIVLIVVGIKIYLDGKNTNDALCSVRQDMEQRALGTTQFLKDNPDGFAGIPVRTLLENLANQQRTIQALKGLECSYELSKPPSFTVPQSEPKTQPREP
jgi:hypothetical protein